MSYRNHLSILLLLVCTTVVAGPRSMEQARQIAGNFLQSLQTANTPSPILTPVSACEARSRNGRVNTQLSAYHILNAEGGGYVIVSGDDRFRDIIGYSTVGTFDPTDLPEPLCYWLQFLSEEMEAVQTGQARLLSEPAQALESETDIAPLLKSHWMQQYPFNAQVPAEYTTPFDRINESYKGRASTGCVALAMGQLMNYWKYPSQGQGGIHTNSANSKASYSLNFNEQTYDWNLVQDDYGAFLADNGTPQNAPYTKEQADEVAKICYHAGLAADAKWNELGDGSTSAVNGNALKALITHFGYNSYAYMQQRAPISPTAFSRLLQSELQASRPILYSGYSSETGRGTGHFFIIDGYDAATKTYHINWGWQGQYNGYYALSALEPGKGVGYGMGNYNYGQTAIIGLQPEELYFDYTPAISAQSFSIDKTSILRGSEQTFVHAVGIANDDPKFSGSLGVAIYSLDGKLEHKNLVEIPNFTVGNSGTISFPTPFFNALVPVGQHVMRIVMKTSDDKYYPVHAAYGNVESWKVEVTNGKPGTVAFTPIVPSVPNSIADIAPDTGHIISTEFFTLGGIRVSSAHPGILLQRKTYADGTVSTVKIINRQ